MGPIYHLTAISDRDTLRFVNRLGNSAGRKMLKQFKTLADLYHAFSDNQVALAHFKSIRWRDGEFCPYCGVDKVYTLKANRYQCSECRNTFSILVGTIFENTKLPLKVWFGAIWLLTNHPKGIASTTLAKDLGITRKIGVVRSASAAPCGAYSIIQYASNDRQSGN